MDLERIGIGGGAAGVELLLNPRDLLAATAGRVADLTLAV